MKQPIEPIISSGGGLKIKTLEEIKAEKELKKKMLEEEMNNNKSSSQMEVTIPKEEIKPQIDEAPASNETVTSSLNRQTSNESNNKISLLFD